MMHWYLFGLLVLLFVVALVNFLYDMKVEDVHSNDQNKQYYDAEKQASKVLNYVGLTVSSVGVLVLAYYVFFHKTAMNKFGSSFKSLSAYSYSPFDF